MCTQFQFVLHAPPRKSCPIPSQLVAIAQLSAHANVPRFPAYFNQQVQRQITSEFHSKLSISQHSLEIVPNWIFYPQLAILFPIRDIKSLIGSF